MEISKTEELLYFDWFFQPKQTQLAFKCFGRFRAQMPPATAEPMEVPP